MKIAVAKYPVHAPASFADFARRITTVLGQASEQGARIAVLPEYLSLELAASLGEPVAADLKASLAGIQAFRQAWMALFSGLAQQLGMDIVAGSFLLEHHPGRYRNRCDWFCADGRQLWQDKLQLTGFEKNTGIIDPGDVLKVFEIDGIRIGVAICYDSEFPLPVRRQYEAGARLLIVPSCTDTAAGAMRVRIGCLARALENRMFVAQSVTAGLAEWSPALDTNTGEAAIYAPMDVGFPSDGVLAQTDGQQLWAYADLDFAAFEASRKRAQVANDRDWQSQLQPALAHAVVTCVD